MKITHELPDITSKKIKAILKLEKARKEFFSFVIVRIKYNDIFKNYQTLTTFLRLEKNIVIACNELNKINERR